MTTTRTASANYRTEKIIVLAADMFQTCTELAERPITGHFKEYAELNERWLARAVRQLHDHLIINREHLDAEWVEMIDHTASVEAFDQYGA